MALKGFPVVVSTKFGIPVIPVTKNAPFATVAPNGLGIPIRIVGANGIPLIVSGLPT